MCRRAAVAGFLLLETMLSLALSACIMVMLLTGFQWFYTLYRTQQETYQVLMERMVLRHQVRADFLRCMSIIHQTPTSIVWHAATGDYELALQRDALVRSYGVYVAPSAQWRERARSRLSEHIRAWQVQTVPAGLRITITDRVGTWSFSVWCPEWEGACTSCL